MARGDVAQPRAPRARYKVELARQRRRNFATLVTVLAMITPLVVAAGWVVANVKHSTEGNTDIPLDVKPGWTSAQIGDVLQQKGVITSSHQFQQIALFIGLTKFTAGKYDFYTNEGERAAIDNLRFGGPAAAAPDEKLLLPPGLTLDKIAQRVGALPGKSAVRFLQVARSGTIRSKYEPPGVSSLEGLTWPDTYFIGANETETQILQTIVSQFDKQADALGLSGATGLSPFQTLTLASMVQGEAGTDADAPLISAVIHNRLAKNMLLQVDDTLCYAKGGCPPVPSAADRNIDSPYNTYKVAGLPPGPIETASAVALKGALHPAAVDYLFYVSDKNGKTYYATTQQDQDRNVIKARNAN
jgi:UPF0755 protein